VTPRHAAPAAPTQRTAEHARLAESPSADEPWRRWGPYLSGRQWGTVREDYSANGDAWSYLPFDQAHARAYRWGEDGLGGFSDRYGFLNFSVALWNRRDPILKERLFGLTNSEGNHGEDAKEYWWALDGTPTHSLASWLYRYPQAEYPYAELRERNAQRSRTDREFELSDTGVLAEDRFFDVAITYAKAGPEDICITIDVTNHGPDPAPLDLIPQLWFHNTWSWGRDDRRPSLTRIAPEKLPAGGYQAIAAEHGLLGLYTFSAQGDPDVLVCDNETNAVALFGVPSNPTRYTKDGINQRIVHSDTSAVNPDGVGTKAAFWYRFDAIAPGQTERVSLRLSAEESGEHTFGTGFTAVLADRQAEADEFYADVLPADLNEEDRQLARRAFAGLLWGKQLYRYDVQAWLEGDPSEPVPPPDRARPGGRNVDWHHLALADVISMPDEWEYPWFAAWDLAFHCVAFAHIDPAFAKGQLLLMGREWAMHPNGQLPAYEWAFGDVNPPVQAWATWLIYVIDGGWDRDFLIRSLTKMLLNFAWWVNRKDADGSNLFEGGFLGMDNIGLFDRSAPLPPGHRLEESDATSWMAFYCLQLLQIATELARTVPAWDDVATKFLEHFLSIAHATRQFGSQDVTLWDEEDGFFYDVLVRPDGGSERLRVRSMVGLLPLLAVTDVPGWVATELPDFTGRLRWLLQRRPELLDGVLHSQQGDREHFLLSLVDPPRLERIAARIFDPDEFLSPYGIRSLSAAYRSRYTCAVEGVDMSIDYEPGESCTGLFGGNSNWRGPIWFPVNALLVDAMTTLGGYLGDSVLVPAADGGKQTFDQAAEEVRGRLLALFRKDEHGHRASDGQRIEASPSPLWSEHPTFSEYFNGDTGEGLGASHQTGWTAMVAHLLCWRK
jgi:hypothetical protein